METRVDIHDAKTRLSQLVAIVEAGGEVVIARSGKPVARLVPYAERSGTRQFGTLKGRLELSREWDAPLEGDELAAWHEAPILPGEAKGGTVAPSPARKRGRSVRK